MSRPLGIDLGTTYSAVATLDDAGTPIIARNENGEETTPSVVWFEDETNVVVGSTAKENAVVNPDSVLSLIKRQMGTNWSQDFFGQTYTPETISSLILRNLVDGANATLGSETNDVVITVPAYFGQLEREATKAAGQIAGLNVLSIIPEPVAAALHYDVTNDTDGRTILVFDLGGGTFDISVMTVDNGKFRVLVTDGDQELGGADWDRELVNLILERYVAATGDTDAELDDAFLQEIATKAEQAKKNLSTAASKKLPLRHDGNSATVEITRDEFNGLTRHLVDDTVTITRRALRTLEAKHGSTRIDDVILVGGSTRMPAITEALRNEFGWEPRVHDPDLAVAKGAAIFALGRQVHEWMENAESAGGSTGANTTAAIAGVAAAAGLDFDAVAAIANKETRNVLPKAIGVQLVRGADHKPYIDCVIDQNTEIPLAEPVYRSYGTAQNNQTQVALKLFQQASAVPSEDVEANELIDRGTGTITGFPPRPAGDEIQVEYNVDAEGAISMNATHVATGLTAHVQVRVAVLSEEDIAQQATRVSLLKVSAS
ncbi:MAG: Hsp70 family protein [Gordonia sp. (in: high G+C Gram-positive bacteria)]|uniref:Hsp70 family protein n=1 Tax=Gordonia sp. (in: high G+C Gram-positive bacteria) TaxID=84139 RepID=UPI0039E413FD